MSLPFNWLTPELGDNDPLVFRYFLSDIVRRHLPCSYVEVIPAIGGEHLESLLEKKDMEALALTAKKGKPVIAADTPRLFLPLKVDEKPYATAIIEGGEPALYEKYTVGDLLKGSRAITEDFLSFRARSVDPLTGLFNSVAWRETLEERMAEGEGLFLVLLEIYPRIRDAAHAYSYLKRAAGALNSMSGQEVPVFHLGSGLFGMLWKKVSVAEARTMADVILYQLQRDGMSRVHLSQVWIDRDSKDFDRTMDRALKTLVKARQRGPFARAVYQSEVELHNHPFRPLSAFELNRFKDLWGRSDNFSVAALHSDQGDDRTLREDIRVLLNEGMTLVEGEQRLFLFIENAGLGQAIKLLKTVQKRFGEVVDKSFSAGLATFPHKNFKRSAIPINARKALQHAFFLGPSSITMLDGVSLNISGDVYYNEGDMNGAVREYLVGLELDDRNINLLNSLGVAYIRLDRFKTAVGCFEKVLDIEPENFMALFNLGSAWLTLERDDLAVEFLERALTVDDSIFDLYLQLAELYCRAGSYEKVVDLLVAGGEAPERREEWEDASALRCLGEAWYNLGEQPKAMECLQKACAYNPRDSKALSLLGEVYDIEGQGVDIAMALCKEAVDLDDGKWDNWLRLGRVQQRNGRKKEAISALQRSLKINRFNIEAARLLKGLYGDAGKKRLVEGMAEKIRKIKKQQKVV